MAAITRFYQRAKNAAHAFQALAIVVGACLTIGIYAKGAHSDGRINYYFALCFVTIAALLYQAAFPIFPRVRRFSHAYAHAILDLVFCIFWFAAFIGDAIWVKDGSRMPAKSTCDLFDPTYGPVITCKLAQGALIVGVIVWVSFGLTTAISMYGVSYFRKNGHLPEGSTKAPQPVAAETGDDDTYNLTANPDDCLESASRRQERPPYRRDQDEMSSLHSGPEHAVNLQSVDVTNRTLTSDLHLDHSSEPAVTSYHGSTGKTYASTIPTSPPAYSQSRLPSPHFEKFNMQSNQSHFGGEIKPGKVPVEEDPFSDDVALAHEHSGYGSGNHIGFPQGDYHQ